MVEACVYDDGETCSEKACGGEDEKRKWSVFITMVPSSGANEESYLRKKWGNRWRLGTRR